MTLATYSDKPLLTTPFFKMSFSCFGPFTSNFDCLITLIQPNQILSPASMLLLKMDKNTPHFLPTIKWLTDS